MSGCAGRGSLEQRNPHARTACSSSAVGWCILVAEHPALLSSLACCWRLYMPSAVMGNGDLQLQICLAMAGTGHESVSLVQPFSTRFRAAW